MRGLKDGDLFKQDCLIGGRWVSASSGETLTVTTPEDGSVLGTVPKLSAEEVREAIDAAHDAQKAWQAKNAKFRSQVLRNWYDLVIENVDDLGRILSAEQGKPWAEGRGEIQYGATFLDWFSEEAKRAYGDIIPATADDRRIMVLKQPVGVVGAITPWNFPCAMITRKAGAALAAGCSIVIKPASATPYTALALAELAERAGVPAGIVNVVTGSARVIGAELTGNEKVRKISFTGSTEIGVELLKQCAPTVKKVSMELGGNAPLLVFDDADVDVAVQGTMASKFRNAGQTCVCANRIFVQDGIYDAYAAKLKQAIDALKVGKTFDDGVEIGPLVDMPAVEKVEEHINDAVAKGGTVLSGGKRHALGGSYFEPTLIGDTPRDALLMQEETFGPVAPLIRFSSEDEGIELANNTAFGLAAYAFTNDLNRAWRLAEKIESGIVGINEGATSTEVAPFGGYKQSGIGREGSKYGLEDYLEIKYVAFGNVK